MSLPLSLLLCVTTAAAGAARPNVLWITCEDISPYLGCYGCAEAQTPHLDALAAAGVRFTRAYANAPVCAVARSTILSGMYATTLGTHQMRSRPKLPSRIPAYPQLLRAAGYFCTNNSKTDYNSSFETRKQELWDECGRQAHWQHRPDGTPFFAVFNLTCTHEGQLSPGAQQRYLARHEIPAVPRNRPEDIVLPPYHPDLPEIRGDWARLHDLITLMDRQVGERLAEVEAAGLAEDTIVFFYADHGGQLARSKRYIYNVGTQVPLIVRVPPRWRHLAPGAPGTTDKALAQFVDLPKTLLSLLGITPPALMQGRVLFGPGREAPATAAHFFRDRMAERYDCSRAVTDGRFYYIRNFMPHRPRGRDSRYGYTVQRNWAAWEAWYDRDPDGADPLRAQFYRPKPVEQLFDTQADPWHVNNLAARPEYAATRVRLAADLERWIVETRDVGLLPEPLCGDLVGEGKAHATLYDYAQSSDYPVARVLAAAQTASAAAVEATACLALLDDAHPAVRYWGAYGLFRFRQATPAVQAALRVRIAQDPHAANRVMAAQALALCGAPDTACSALRREARQAVDGYVLLLALNALQYSHTDDRLTRDDWQGFEARIPASPQPADRYGWEYSQRLIKDALALWPRRRPVD